MDSWPAQVKGGDFFQVLFLQLLKGDVSRKFDVISKPQNVCLPTETKK